MRTGFYDISKLDTKTLKKFFKDAVMLSYDSHVEILDCNISRTRERCTTKTIQDMITKASFNYHNVCINRSVQHESETYGEIGYSTLRNPDYFLYIYVTLENFYKLVEKYKLKEL